MIVEGFTKKTLFKQRLKEAEERTRVVVRGRAFRREQRMRRPERRLPGSLENGKGARVADPEGMFSVCVCVCIHTNTGRGGRKSGAL